MWTQIRLQQSDLDLQSVTKRFLEYFSRQEQTTCVVIGALRVKSIMLQDGVDRLQNTEQNAKDLIAQAPK